MPAATSYGNPAAMCPTATGARKKLLSPADVAALYGIPPATLATWRCRGVGPDFIKAESSVYYLPEQVDAWLRRCAVVMPR